MTVYNATVSTVLCMPMRYESVYSRDESCRVRVYTAVYGSEVRTLSYVVLCTAVPDYGQSRNVCLSQVRRTSTAVFPVSDGHANEAILSPVPLCTSAIAGTCRMTRV